MIRILTGDCRAILPTLATGSVQCCVTSPPYFGLRDYGTGTWAGGDPACDHGGKVIGGPKQTPGVGMNGHASAADRLSRQQCAKCGAIRVDQQIGAEPSPDAYIAELVAVFREVRRVLRDDGTVWLNLGSSYASKRIESDRHIIRRDLSDADRSKVAQALSAVWSGHESAEQAVQGLPRHKDSAPRELSDKPVPEVRNDIQDAQDAPCQILLSEMCEIRQPDQEAGRSDHALHHVRQAGEANTCGHAEETDGCALLLDDMLVSVQPAGAALPLGGRSTSEVESNWQGVAAICYQPRSQPMPALLCERETRGTSHSSVPQPSREAVGVVERDNCLSELPPSDGTQRDGVRQRPDRTGGSAAQFLARIAFARAAIPTGFEQWCEPESVVKPKDDLAIPEAVAKALRDDGWFLRSRIIWHKVNPMPESIQDRPTSAHEHVFLLSKRATYFFDADAVAEVSTSFGRQHTTGIQPPKVVALQEDGTHGRGGDLSINYERQSRNIRNVWTIATSPYSAAHFATFPPELAERCIKAGTKPGDTVLDPFGGAGTTGLVADRLGRDAVLIELNPSYVTMTQNRIVDDAPLFAQVAAQ